MVDVDYDSFNTTADNIQRAITRATRAIIPVHLFGQSCPMEGILDLAREHRLHVIEDNAQSIGARYTFSDGTVRQTGTMGTFGCISFFPTKNLGCMGDGGIIISDDQTKAQRAQLIAAHGQSTKYFHDIVGCNSRLDTLQAAVLSVKLRYLDECTARRQRAAEVYDEGLRGVKGITTPRRMKYSTHVFHQYTLKVAGGQRDGLRQFLADNGVQSMVYYPLPVHRQAAYRTLVRCSGTLPVATALCESVLSLPIHTEMTPEMVQYIAENLVEIVQ